MRCKSSRIGFDRPLSNVSFVEKHRLVDEQGYPSSCMKDLLLDPKPDCNCEIRRVLIGHSDNNLQMQESLYHLVDNFGQAVNEKFQITLLDVADLFSVSSVKTAKRFIQTVTPITLLSQKLKVIEYSQSDRNERTENPKAVEDAIRSELHSFFQDDKIPTNLVSFLLSKSLRKRAGLLGAFLEKSPLVNKHFCYVVVNNGRQVSSTVLRTWAKDRSTKVLYWERNDASRTVWLCDHPPQDFFAYIDEFNNLKDCEQDDDAVQKWLKDQRHSKLQNTYLKRFEESGTKTIKSNLSGELKLESDFVLLAPSSDDEYESLGRMFPEKNFKNQFEGFESALQSSDQKFRLVLRIHPNYYNKSSNFLMRRYKEIFRFIGRYPQTTIVYPLDKINTYHLVERAKLLITGNSTLGVEAICLGKKVVHINHSPFPVTSDLSNIKPKFMKADFGVDLSEVAKKEIQIKLIHRQRVKWSSDTPTNNWTTFHTIIGLKRIWPLVRLLTIKKNRILYYPITKMFQLFLFFTQKFRYVSPLQNKSK